MLPEVLPGEVPSSHFCLTFHPFFPAWDLVQPPPPPPANLPSTDYSAVLQGPAQAPLPWPCLRCHVREALRPSSSTRLLS